MMEYKTFAGIVDCDANNVTLENANINSVVPAGMMMKFASESAKEFAHDYLLSKEAKDAVDNNIIHIHDLDYYPTKSTTCVQHPLDKILQGGFQASDGTARPCKRIETAGALAAIAMQTVQNEQHGGQAIPAFDFYMAPYVLSTYKEELWKVCEDEGLSGEEFEDLLREPVTEYVITGGYHPIDRAVDRTVKRVHQAMEAFIHNMNTMRSRGGGQTVFSSINYGTDVSPEGRCIIRELLISTYEGVGNGQTAIFPIQIFKLKKGVNTEPTDPNYDLLQLACVVTAKRFFPNFVNLDAPFNYYEGDDGTDYYHQVATMGCRTRVFEDRHGDKTSIGRGNLSFTTINLPRLALMSEGNYAKFLELLEETVDVTVRQLYDRYAFQCTALKKQFPMLMNGMWMDSDKLQGPDSVVADVLKHGTLGVGFIGLAECLIVLTGHHHGEDYRSQQLGIKIITEIRDRCKYWSDKLDLNVSVLATPAESLAGRFVIKDRKDFGSIPNVTDRDYYTNSNHVPVWYKCTMEEKAAIEAPYHPLTLAGHIFYVEFDGDAARNPEAVMDFVKLIRNYNIGYASVNHTRSRCLDCGFENADSDLEACPNCGSTNIDTIQRITGYLVGCTSRWNKGKKAELRDRVTHTK